MPIKKNSFKRKHVLYALSVILAVGAIGYGIYHYNHKNSPIIIPSTNPSLNKPALSSNKSTTGSGSGSGAQANSSPSVSQSKIAQPTTNSSTQLITPYGVFASNHQPQSTGLAAYQNEQSVCNTTPGASCYIEFTKGSTVEQLPPQTTNGQGATFWSWNINSAGLTSGTWTIKAVASLNGQTITAQDSTNLEVQ